MGRKRNEFATSATLICVHGDHALRDLTMESSTSIPYLDQICREGSTIGVMMTQGQLAGATEPQGLVPHLLQIARSQVSSSAFDGVVIHSSEKITSFSQRAPDEKIGFVYAESLSEANEVAEEVLRRLRLHQPCAHPRTCDAGVTSSTWDTADIVGFMVTASGNWEDLAPNPSEEVLKDALQLPCQSFETDKSRREILHLSGIVTWCGHGLVRCDERESLAQRMMPPGEGFLRLDQIVSEVLAKTGFTPKYGA